MNALVAQARTYLGTPYRHRGRSRRAIDCAGLLWCSYADLGYVLPDVKVYGREPHRDGLMAGLIDALGEPVWRGTKPARSLLKVGDCIVSAFVREPHHLAIVGNDPLYGLSLIHADGNPGISRVVEEGMSAYRMNQIVAIFRRPV